MSTFLRFQRCYLQVIRGARPCIQAARSLHARPTIRLASSATDTTQTQRQQHSRSSEIIEKASKLTNSIDIAVQGSVYPASPVWLRDACPCSACVDPSTRQKNFATVDIPEEITGQVTSSDAGAVTVQWSNDIPGSPPGHTTTLSEAQLVQLFGQSHRTGEQRTHGRVGRQKWSDSSFRKLTSDISYDQYMENDRALKTALNQLQSHGLVFLTGVPQTESAIVDVAERIGPLKNTFYGLTWDVRSVPEAKNVAYTSGDLGFHMDLMYLNQPPALQLLHCIRSSARGGASRFTDIYTALIQLLNTDREAFDALLSQKVNYHYDHPTQFYSTSRYIVESPVHVKSLQGLPTNAVAAILGYTNTRFAWSPPFQAPFQPPFRHSADGITRLTTTDEWHAAARKLNEILHRPENVHERMLGSGDLVIFNNRRVLHARTAFHVGDAGVERWLKGCYIDSDAWSSKISTLAQKLGH